MTAVPINEKVPIIKGLDLSNEKLSKSLDENKMLLIDVETSNVCNLNCTYCFRDVYGTKDALKDELSLKERFNLMKQAKELGCETIKISGAGEPLIDPYFFDMVEFANKLGMWVISFTNGFVIDKWMAERMYKLNLSLIVKCNSKIPEIEDKMVGKEGYAERRNKSLKYLMDAGFNKAKPTRLGMDAVTRLGMDAVTRLGMDAVITKFNIKDIINNLKFCRENNIFPMFKPMMPIGGAKKLKDWEISKQETINLYEKARDFDRKNFDLNYKLVLPYMGGVWCRQLHYALYVNILGEVYVCTGSNKLLGNIRNSSLKNIWNGRNATKIRSAPYDSCPLREAYWRGEKNCDCI